MMPIYKGRFSRGEAPAMIVMAPFISPEEPRPATARPTMRAVEVGATPHSSDPNSKTKRKTRKVYCLHVSINPRRRPYYIGTVTYFRVEVGK
jgi:hypothetical protein